MEASRGRESIGLLDEIIPPRPEDAALVDWVPPADSINKAFLKAASALKLRAATFFHSDEEDEVEPACLDDPLLDKGKCSSDILVSPPCPEMPDVLVGGGSSDPASNSVGSCVKEKGSGGMVVVGMDMVAVGGDGGVAMDGKGCVVDELKGLKIGENERRKNENLKDEIGEEKPILVEDFVLVSHPN